MAASWSGVTPKSKRAPVAHHAQATGAFLLPRQRSGVVEVSLVELQRSCAARVCNHPWKVEVIMKIAQVAPLKPCTHADGCHLPTERGATTLSFRMLEDRGPFALCGAVSCPAKHPASRRRCWQPRSASSPPIQLAGRSRNHWLASIIRATSAGSSIWGQCPASRT